MLLFVISLVSCLIFTWPLLYFTPRLAYIACRRNDDALLPEALFWGIFVDTLAPTPFGIFALSSLVAAIFMKKNLRFFSLDPIFRESLAALLFSIYFRGAVILLSGFFAGQSFSILMFVLGIPLDLVWSLSAITLARKITPQKARFIEGCE